MGCNASAGAARGCRNRFKDQIRRAIDQARSANMIEVRILAGGLILRSSPLGEDAMKIDAVELTLFAWDDIPTPRYTQGAQNTSGRSNLGLLRISTDAGIEGHAFLGSAVNPAETDAVALILLLKPVLIGEDLHAAMRARQRHLGLRAIGACDTALWDLAAKAAGMPLYQFLGGGRAAIGAYASSQMLESRDAYAAEAAQFKAEGRKAYKIHPPQNPAEDIKVCEDVRAAVGEDFTLMQDSTWSYRYPDDVR